MQLYRVRVNEAEQAAADQTRQVASTAQRKECCRSSRIMPFSYLSLFDGIGAATEAWEPLGWECVGVAEIEAFPIAVGERIQRIEALARVLS
jgi:hypothetical protein